MGMSKPWVPASTRGMHYMSNAPQMIDSSSGDVFDSIEGARCSTMGLDLQDEIKREVARQAARQMIDAAKDAISGFGLNFHPLSLVKSGLRLSARPFTYQANLANRLIHGAAHARLPGEGGGGGGGAAAPADAPPEGGGDAPADDSTEGRILGMLQSPGAASRISYLEGAFPGITAQLVQRLRHGRRGPRGNWRMHGADASGWSLNPLNLFHKAKPAGKLLVSATPGGTTALQAHAIANKAIKSGALKPEHLKKAAALTKAGRKGDDKALVKIASIKAQAGRGDPHAQVALDRIKLAHCLQTGQVCKGGGGTLSRNYSDGLAALRRR